MARYKGSVKNQHQGARAYANRKEMYVHGSTARQPEFAPQRKEEQPLSRPKKQPSVQVRKNRNRAMRMSAGYVVFLAIAAVVALVVCVQFLQVRSEVSNRSKNISAMQQELASLKEENRAEYNSVMNSVNLEDVRLKAVEELGMIYASEGQIIEYENPTSDYIRQYEEIPESGVLAASGKVTD